jgi:hypothetical protein
MHATIHFMQGRHGYHDISLPVESLPFGCTYLSFWDRLAVAKLRPKFAPTIKMTTAACVSGNASRQVRSNQVENLSQTQSMNRKEAQDHA